MKIKIKRLFYDIWVWFGKTFRGWKTIYGCDYGHAVDESAEIWGYMDENGVHHIEWVINKTENRK